MSQQKMQDLTEGYVDEYDPAFEAINPTEEATSEEESYYAAGIDAFLGHLYSEDGAAKVAQVLQQDKRPLHQVIPEILKPMFLKVQSELQKAPGEEVPSSIYVAEDGLFEVGVEALFDLAKQLAIPGADSKDEFAAALIGTFKMFGEHLMESGDEDAQHEAIALGGEMLMTDGEGHVRDFDKFSKQEKAKDPLAQDISAALGGME